MVQGRVGGDAAVTVVRDQLPGPGTTKAAQDRTTGDDVVHDNHRFVRDGSVWLCMHCKLTYPYPQPMPVPAAPCVPRRWGDQ